MISLLVQVNGAHGLWVWCCFKTESQNATCLCGREHVDMVLQP